jgi:hypothetical protein
MFSREVMHFTIKNKEIYYQDKLWQSAIRCIPKDEDFITKIRNSRNRYSPKLIEMFTLSKKQQEEYENASNEEQLSDIIILDCKRK